MYFKEYRPQGYILVEKEFGRLAQIVAFFFLFLVKVTIMEAGVLAAKQDVFLSTSIDGSCWVGSTRRHDGKHGGSECRKAHSYEAPFTGAFFCDTGVSKMMYTSTVSRHALNSDKAF